MNWTGRDLGELLRLARKDAGRSQFDVADALQISEATVGSVERGERIPGLDVLARLAAEYQPDPEQRAELLTRWLLKWLESKVHAAKAPQTREVLDDAARSLLQGMSAPTRALPAELPRSLEGFPEQFEPLIAVFPDRREVPPDSPADLFIRSGAVTDYQYLPLLRGLSEPLTIYTDKFFVLMNERWLRERFSGHNLLVVGSSGVNWLTRSLANRALFRPLIEPYWRQWDKAYRDSKELDDHRLLGAFWRLVEQRQHSPEQRIDPDAIPRAVLGTAAYDRLPRAAALAEEILQGRSQTDIIQQFRIPGFADPADGVRHGQLPGDHTDFGVVSLAPHPFDDSGRFVSIIVAGISGPGTAHGLRGLLTEQSLFANHPFGGVIRVHLPAREEGWPGRFENADWSWQTDDYTPGKILANLRQARAAKDPSRRKDAFRDCAVEELDQAIAFVERLTGGQDSPDAA